MNNRFLTYIITTVLIVTLLAGCQSKEATETDNEIIEESTTAVTTTETEVETTAEPKPEPEPEPEPEVDPYEGMVINSLTGLYMDEEDAFIRPIAVTISDIQDALPQSGIAEADVIYETLAEGGIPRLVAVFHDFEGERIGPIRSGRHYFIDYAFDFDALYAHYGKSPQAQTAFTALNSPHMDGLSWYEETMTYQADDRYRPHATYTTKEMLLDTADLLGYNTEIDSEFENKFEFYENELDEEFEIDTDENIVDSVELYYSYYITSVFDYDEEEKIYYHFQYDEPHTDVETEEQLSFKNIIVQLTDMWVIPGDEYGRLEQDLINVGTGYYITNGKYMEIVWEKTSHYEPTKYYLPDGQPLQINKGKTWISVFPSYNESEIDFIDKE